MKTPHGLRPAFWALWLALLLTAVLGLRTCWADNNKAREVSVTGYNYTQRPIYTFTVNGGSGSNIFINGGGGSFSCCTLVTVGQLAEVDWMYSYTEKQYEAGLREESFKTTVTVPPPPPEHPQARYLEVHFYPDGHVELALVKFPGPRRLPDWPEEK